MACGSIHASTLSLPNAPSGANCEAGDFHANSAFSFLDNTQRPITIYTRARVSLLSSCSLEHGPSIIAEKRAVETQFLRRLWPLPGVNGLKATFFTKIYECLYTHMYRKYPRIRRTFFHRGKNQKLGVRLIRRYSPGLPHATCGPAVVDSPMLRHVRRVTFDRFARKFVTRPDLKIKIDSTCAAGADCERQQNQSTIKRRYPCVKIKCVK